MLAPCIFYCDLWDSRKRPNHRNGNRAPLTGILPLRLLSPHPVSKITHPSRGSVGAGLDPLCSRHAFSIVFCGILVNGRTTSRRCTQTCKNMIQNVWHDRKGSSETPLVRQAACSAEDIGTVWIRILHSLCKTTLGRQRGFRAPSG